MSHHHPDELLAVDLSISINIGLSDHLIKLPATKYHLRPSAWCRLSRRLRPKA